jgi:hypothetical protein
MATKVRFGNKIIQLPGTYSRIISGQNNPPRELDYGKLLIIDNPDLNATLAGTGMLGGAGVNGTLAFGKDAIYKMTDISEFRDFVGGNWWWKAAEALFNPDGRGNGVSEIHVIKPATTTPSIMTFTATGGGAAGGTFKIKTHDESTEANGLSNETRAQSHITVTSAGSTGDKITLKVSGVTVAEYTNASSDSIATVVAGLAANMTVRALCEVVSSTSPTVTFKAPKGLGLAANSITPSITVTGTATATTAIFTGGVTSTNLISGYAYTIETGVIDTSKWIYKLWRGTYKGLYSDLIPYDEVYIADTRPVLVAQSPEFNNIQTLIDWAVSDGSFGQYFVIDATSAKTGLGTVTAADITNLVGYQPSTGGTATYDSLDDALDAIKDLNYNYILTTSSTANPSTDTDIMLIVDHITVDAKYDKYLLIAGHNDTLATTIGYAETFDNEKVNVVHGGIKLTSRMAASGFRIWDPFFHAAFYAGRILGLAPWVPITYKSLNMDGLVDKLNDKSKLKADSAGVLATVFDDDFGKFICLHDVNTLQNSDFVLNPDGTSHLIQIERIKSQLNKELIVNSKLDLMSDPAGVNRTSLTEEDAVEWTKTYLQRRLGTLIVDYRNVTATTVEDVIFVDYEASPNTEIKSIFFTGRLYL